MTFSEFSSRDSRKMPILRSRLLKKDLPATVLTFVEQEKWPSGHLFFRRYESEGETCLCVASPICAMGWGRDEFGNWIHLPSHFRIRESAENFDENLKLASFTGGTFEVIREDGLKDIIYSEPGQRPATGYRNPLAGGGFSNIIQEREISNYAHSFYARLARYERFPLCLAQLVTVNELLPWKILPFPILPDPKDIPLVASHSSHVLLVGWLDYFADNRIYLAAFPMHDGII